MARTSRPRKDSEKVARRPAEEVRSERHRISIMIALTLFGFSLAFVFVRQDLLPYLARKEAQEAVYKKEEAILEKFFAGARQKNFTLWGWDTQVFPRLAQVTYVYQEPDESDRKAFWWAYQSDAPEGEKVHRIKSVAEFVDTYLLPTVDQIHKDITGIPGPLAVVRHQKETM